MLRLTRILKATHYSLKGLKAAWQQETAFRQECWLLLMAIGVVLSLDISYTHQLLLIASVVLVLIVEIINSAIETIIDRISPTHHPLSAQAKDMGSAAVFLTLLLAIFIWCTILWKR
jgi:diacylglycerol kinase (ATP)